MIPAMYLRLIAFSCLAIFVLQGCIPSLHPLYTAKEVVTNDRLKQTKYFDQNEETTWAFSAIPGEKAYHLKYFEKDKLAEFKVHLVQLDEYLFLDFYPITKVYNADPEADDQALLKNMFFDMHLMPVHSFAKVELNDEGGMTIRQFDTEWLKTLFKERRIRIKHEQTSQGIILTASTKELQKFILKYAEEEKAYTEAIVLHEKI